MRCPNCQKTHYKSRDYSCDSCGVVPNDFVRRAVARIEESRESHQRWADFLKEHPGEHERFRETIHTREENLRIVREYDHVIRALTSFLPRTPRQEGSK